MGEMKLLKFGLFGIFIFFWGCASAPYVVLINPELDHYTQCRGGGEGLGGMAKLHEAMSDCVERVQGWGWKRAEDLTAEEKKRLRLPPLQEVFMVNSKSGYVKKCRAEPTETNPSYILIVVKQCVEKSRTLGYKRAEELTAEDQHSRNVAALVHPKSGDVKYCASWVPLSYKFRESLEATAVSNCTKQFQILGYKRAQDLTAEERSRLRLND